MAEKYYLDKTNVGTWIIKKSSNNFPLSGQRYGFLKLSVAQHHLDDLNTGKETPESLRRLWEAGTIPIPMKGR